MRRALLVLLLAACAPMGPVASPAPGGLGLGAGPRPRLDRPTLTVARFASTGGVERASDSLAVAVAWALPTVNDNYGPIDSLRLDILGGYPAAAAVLWLAPTETGFSWNLPFNLAGSGSPATGTIGARACIQTIRRGVLGPQICRDGEVTVTFPAPPGVTGLTVGVSVRAFP